MVTAAKERNRERNYERNYERNCVLLAWYDAHGRDLPWRGETDPWRVLVVEVMSQQTQVSRVVERWEAFLTRFPDPKALADAPPEEALRAWADLGYLRRLTNLRKAAGAIVANGWPDDLTELPGVGEYTAAAVGCFAQGAAVPTVDTNHRRVVSRWLGRPLAGAELRSTATELLDMARPAAWNQAVMDLGASICRRVPECERCPVALWCAGPSVYEPPPRQSRFKGSLRQSRAAIMRALTAGPAATADLIDAHGSRAAEALAALTNEGLVTETPDGWRLV